MVGLAVVTVAAWGSFVSIRSSARGPRWALDHLASIRAWVIGGVAVGLLLTLAIRPLWVGLAVLYVALTVVFLAAMLRRALTRLEEAGGLEELPADQRSQIVRRARMLILAAGVLLGALGVVGMTAGAGPVAWIPTALGLTLVVTALSLSTEGSSAP